MKSLFKKLAAVGMALSVAVGAVGAVELTHSSVTKASTNENQPIKVDDQSTSKLLTPTNHMLLMIDHQPQMAFGTKSIDVATLRNNVAGLAEAAKTFKVPTVLTTVASKSFSGSIFPEIKKVFPDQKIYDRTSMNAWDDKNVVQAIKDTGKKKIVVAGLWTEVCVVMPVLEALNDGYEVYVVTDASGGVTDQAHNMAVERMVQAGATPITWMQYMLELQRDWANQATYDQVLSIAKEHGGAYGLGIQYAKEMFDTGEGK